LKPTSGLLVILAACLAACTGTASPSLAPGSGSPSILPLLGSAEYPLDFSPTGNVRLSEGSYEGPAAPGASTALRVRTEGSPAQGDLNGDGVPDAAVVLAVDPGGSGTFHYLFAVLDSQGRPRPAASALLGDRVEVTSVGIEDGVIQAAVLERAPGEPLSSPPTVARIHRYRLVDGALREIGGP
jgi:hypothetical protein